MAARRALSCKRGRIVDREGRAGNGVRAERHHLVEERADAGQIADAKGDVVLHAVADDLRPERLRTNRGSRGGCE